MPLVFVNHSEFAQMCWFSKEISVPLMLLESPFSHELSCFTLTERSACVCVHTFTCQCFALSFTFAYLNSYRQEQCQVSPQGHALHQHVQTICRQLSESDHDIKTHQSDIIWPFNSKSHVQKHNRHSNTRRTLSIHFRCFSDTLYFTPQAEVLYFQPFFLLCMQIPQD